MTESILENDTVATGFLMSDEAMIDTLTLEDMRQMYTPKQWRRVIEEQYPDESPDEQYTLCYNEHKDKFKANQLKRMKACVLRSVETKEDAASGRSKVKIIRCGCHDCVTCGPFEEAKLYNAVHNGITGKDIKLVRVEDRTKLIRKYGKDHVKTFAVELDSGRVVYDVLIETDDNIGSPYREVQSEDVKRWLKPVYNHNESGNLFQTKNILPKKEEETPSLFEKVSVTTQVQYVDYSECNKKNQVNMTNLEWAELVEDLSILETIQLNPKCQWSLTTALQDRRKARERWIEKLGGVIFHVEYRKTVILENEIDWLKEADKVRERQEKLKKWLTSS